MKQCNKLKKNNKIIDKFSEFKVKVEQMKNEEILSIQNLFEEERRKDAESYNEQIEVLKGDLEEERKNTNGLMEMFQSKPT